jgi:rubrerythrin
VVAAQTRRYQAEKETMADDVYVCQICGFMTAFMPSANCPVCNVVKETFKRFN